jgi:hypothetical protein
MFKELFFNPILSITIEAFLEFIIYGFLNIYVRDTSTNGEILGLIFAFICILLVIFLINALFWSFFFKDDIQLKSEEFEERWGTLYEFIKTKNMMSRIYNLIFVIRRITFVVICLFTTENGGMILGINIMIDLIYGIYMGHAKAFN